MTDWKEAARATGLRAFPIIIQQDNGKWNKVPLVKEWEKVATTDVERFDWSRANGYGLLMGGGAYALDLDSYKPGCKAELWLEQNRIPETRTHQTISGGRHLIFRLPDRWADLRTRANVVPGLDTRGFGGFIAFGDGYELLDDRPAALLPLDVCIKLNRGGRDSIGGRELPKWTPPDAEATREKLEKAKAGNTRILACFVAPDLRDEDRKDTSRSADDMSLAALLTLQGFDVHEVVWVLLHAYPHGAASRLRDPRMRIRSAMRCAVRAKANRDQRREVMLAAMNEETPVDRNSESLRAEMMRRLGQ